MPRITKRVVDAADPQKDRYIVWDDGVKGFALLVLPTGVKTYFFRYRNAQNRERRLTIGKHGECTANQARERAEELRQAVRAGRDPLQDKQDMRAAPTVGDLLDAYLASPRFAAKVPSTQKIDRGRIKYHLRPLLGRRHVDGLTPDEIRRTLVAIRDGKTAVDVKTGPRGRARVTGGAGTAKAVIEFLRSVFNWAISERRAKTNPCEGVETGFTGTRTRSLKPSSSMRVCFRRWTEWKPNELSVPRRRMACASLR